MNPAASFWYNEKIAIVPLTVDEIVNYLDQFTLAEKSEALYFLHKDGFGESDLNTLWMVVDMEREIVVAEIITKGQEGDTVELGYKTFEGERNKGYMTEAVCLFLDWAKNISISSVYLIVESPNVASLRVAEKCGFKEISASKFVYKL